MNFNGLIYKRHLVIYILQSRAECLFELKCLNRSNKIEIIKRSYYLRNFSIKTFPKNPVPPVMKILRFAYIFRTRSSSMLSRL